MTATHHIDDSRREFDHEAQNMSGNVGSTASPRYILQHGKIFKALASHLVQLCITFHDWIPMLHIPQFHESYHRPFAGVGTDGSLPRDLVKYYLNLWTEAAALSGVCSM